MKKLAYFLNVLVLLLSLIPAGAYAAEFRSSQSGAEVINQTETVANLYVANGTVEINGPVQKDLVAAGGVVNLNSDIEDDAFVVAGETKISGTVGGSLRAGAGTMTITSNIREDAVVAGGNLLIAPESLINGDLIAAFGNMNIGGDINGGVKIAGGNVVISGQINGNVLAKDVEKLTIADGSVITGSLTYYSPNQAEISSGAAINGGVDFHKTIPKDTQKTTGFVIGLVLYELIGTLLLSLFFIYGLPGLSKRIVENSFMNFWPSIGIGILALITVPVVLMLLLFTIVGVKISLFLMLVYCLLLFIAMIMTPVLVGSLLFKWIKRQKGYRLDWIRTLVGIVVVIALMMIPIIGWTILIVLFVLTLGSTILIMYDFFINNLRKRA